MFDQNQLLIFCIFFKIQSQIFEMYNDMQDENQPFESTFEIMIDENDLMASYVLEGQKIKFPKMDLVVNQSGINKLSDPNTQYSKVKIETKNIIEKQKIGKGSAGQVRRAVYKYKDKEYIFAVKSINVNQQDHRKQLLNDLREYLSAQSSQYLIEFYTCYYDDGLVKQVIEFMDMGALRNIINLVSSKKIKLGQEQLAQIISKILMGLNHIHNVRHSIHRDIKPQNILVNSKGQIKITDFGVSKCIEHSFGRSMVGTVTYMSPERLSFDSNSYTYKCDIWSLGLILYELATGSKLPYEAKNNQKFNVFKLTQKILKEQPPKLDQSQFSSQLCDFIKRCLQKNEADRASAIELLNHPWITQNINKIDFREVIEKIKELF